MSFTQLSLQNVTPQQRRFFMLSENLPVANVQEIVSKAWQTFQLAPGKTDYAAYASTFQLAVRSQVSDAQHQLVLVDSAFNTSWKFELNNGIPTMTLAEKSHPIEGQVEVINSSPGATEISLYNNYSQLFSGIEIPTNNRAVFGLRDKLFFYASAPVSDGQQIITLEPEVGEVSVSGPDISVQFLEDDSKLSWRVS